MSIKHLILAFVGGFWVARGAAGATTCRTLSEAEAFRHADAVLSVKILNWDARSGQLRVSAQEAWKGSVPTGRPMHVQVSRSVLGVGLTLDFEVNGRYVLYLLWRGSGSGRSLTIDGCPLRLVGPDGGGADLEREERRLRQLRRDNSVRRERTRPV